MRLAIVAAALLFVPGSGEASFVTTTVGVADAPQRVEAADLDGDGDVDLFVLADGAGQTSSLQVLLNDGIGGFSAGWSAPDAASALGMPWDLNLADTDGDGDIDVLYVPDSSPRQRFNDGNAHFDVLTGLPSFAVRADQEPADLDDNGDVDLVFYEEELIGYFGSLKGAGDGTFDWDFSTEIPVGGSGFDLSRRFVLGDVTGDGLLDAVMASKGGLHLIRGKAPQPPSTLPGWVAPPVKLSATPCLDAVLADLNGDSRLDIVASAPSLGSVMVLLTRPNGAPANPAFFAAGPRPASMAAADLDLDGAADVIVANPTTGSVSVLHGTGEGAFGPPVSFPVGLRPNDIVSADLDGDGDVDLAVACAADGHVAVMLNATL